MLLKTWWSQQKMDCASPRWEDVNDKDRWEDVNDKDNDKVWFLGVPLG